VLLDEQQALQMAFSSMEMKMRELQNENVELVTRWMALKAKDADRMNAENEEFVRLKQERERLELIRAATEAAPPVSLGPKPRYSVSRACSCAVILSCRHLRLSSTSERTSYCVQVLQAIFLSLCLLCATFSGGLT